MKLINILMVVKDMERSKRFYKELFGLDVVLDHDGNVILTEGLVLQEVSIWERLTRKEAVLYHNAAELYFEETDIRGFQEKLDSYDKTIQYVNRLREEPWGQRTIRFYDPDGNLIEVGAPVQMN